jgi:site-specific DNA recombinase
MRGFALDAKPTCEEPTGDCGVPDHRHRLEVPAPGIARCAVCGGSLIVRSRSHGRRMAFFYACGSYHQRGRSVCDNNFEDAMQKVDRSVLAAFERQLLGPGMADEIVAAAYSKMQSSSGERQRDHEALSEGLERIETEIRNLTTGIAAGGELASLITALKEREADRQRLRRQLASAEHAERKTVAVPSKLREELEGKLADWRGVLSRHTPRARQIVKKLLVGPLRFTPRHDRDGTPYYEFEGEGSLEKMLTG